MEKNEIMMTKEEEVLIPIAEQYLQMFPELNNDKSFNAKQCMISLALRLRDTEDKAGRKAIDFCTKESIMRVAQEVLVKKLDPMKSQCALIVRGDKLMLQPQYQGNVKRALELNPNLSHFNFMPIYKNDKVQMGIGKDGRLQIVSHETSFNNISNDNIAGGYVTAIAKDGSVFMTEIMSMEQIKVAWSKSSNTTLSVHKQFPIKMVRKTLLNSICTWLINTTGGEEQVEVDYEEQPQAEYDIDFESVEAPTNEDCSAVQEEEWTQEKVDEVLDKILEEDNAIMEVKYNDWKDNYKPTGKYVAIDGTYNAQTKTIKIQAKTND